MPRKIFLTTVVAALLGASAIPASANEVNIGQYGYAHSAGGAQTGIHNRIGVYQSGRYNKMISRQSGLTFQWGW